MGENASHLRMTGSRRGSGGSGAGGRAVGVGWLAGLRQRALSALVLIPIVIALVWFGGWIAFAGALFALVLGMWELHDMFTHKGWHPTILFSLALSAVFLVVAVLWHEHVATLSLAMLVLLAVSALVVASFGWLILTRKTLDGALLDWALTMATPFYLGLPLAFFLLLRGNISGASAPGFAWLIALFFMVWTNDTFALLVGHYFGHTKLAPLISPAKTWEGFAGGLVFTVIAAVVFTIVIPAVFNLPLHVPWFDAIALGALVAVAGTIGDLAESMLKRGTGVKDSGKIVPGHGGILDRMDSLLFAVFVVFFYAAFLHGIPV
jgi:phosphatidate cytidylyltransferase